MKAFTLALLGVTLLCGCSGPAPTGPDLTSVCLSGSQQYSRGMRLNGLRCLPPKDYQARSSEKPILEWRQDEWDDYRDRMGQLGQVQR